MMNTDDLDAGAFAKQMGIKMTTQSKDRIEGEMGIHPGLYQPWGFLHGGATIAFLESLASRGAEMNTDLEVARPFGIDVHVKHRKSGKTGTLHGCAELSNVENDKQYWNVRATDDEGDVVSEGMIITKIVTLERLAQKAREREEARESRLS